MEMKAGQFVMFWSTLMHASFPNTTTNQTRMAMVARYVPTCVQIYPDQDVVDTFGSRVSLEKYGVVVVAGEDRYRHNRIVTPAAVPESV
jgi:non-heme Fe2+,alpha-ketoglutarate-dependent halogenase